jgi:hypothetical protein
MKNSFNIPLNVGFKETVLRVLLIIPSAWLGVACIVLFHVFFVIHLAGYFLITALISYDPVKHLYSIIFHKPVRGKEPFLYGEQIGNIAWM